MAFEGDNLKQWRSTLEHSNKFCTSQGETSFFFTYFSAFTVQLKELTHLLNLFTLWHKLITFLHLHKQNNSQVKYNESLCPIECGKSIYLFIHPVICMYILECLSPKYLLFK